MKVVVTRVEVEGTATELRAAGWSQSDISFGFGRGEGEHSASTPIQPGLDQERYEQCLAVLKRGRIEPRLLVLLRATAAAGEAGLTQAELADAVGVAAKDLGPFVLGPFGRRINNTRGVPKVNAGAIDLFFTYPTGDDQMWQYVLRPEARSAVAGAGLLGPEHGARRGEPLDD